MKHQNPDCQCKMCEWVRRAEKVKGEKVPLPNKGFWPSDHKEI